MTNEHQKLSGLLALLPKPKTTQQSSTSTGARVQKLTAAAVADNKQLPVKLLAMRPRQAPQTTVNQQQQIAKAANNTHSASSSTSKLKDIDLADDDEEFEARLVQRAAEKLYAGQDEEYPGPEEGPAKPSINANPPKILVNRSLGIDYGDDSEEEEEAEENGETQVDVALPQRVNFFGLVGGTSPKRAKLDEDYVAHEMEEPSIFIDDVAPGPSRPLRPSSADLKEEEKHRQRLAQLRAISDQDAHRLIYEKELAPFGANPMIASDAVNGIIDVSVDAALGPNVRENLLKNLSGKQMAQISMAPLPKVKKSEADKLAKRKHQITHLAAMAVTREEQLQEKWAESKQNKKMSRQKYGF